MGEYVLKDMVAKAGLLGRFHITSAAVSREELGNPVYPPARRELEEYDHIYYMDSSNARYLRRLFCHITTRRIKWSSSVVNLQFPPSRSVM